MNIKCQLPFAVPSVAVRCRAESLCLSTYVVVLVYSVRYRLLFRHRAVCHYRCTVDLVPMLLVPRCASKPVYRSS